MLKCKIYHVKVGAAHLATWLTYLRIAQKIKDRINGIELSYLMLGFVAPFLNKEQEGDLEFTDMVKFSKSLMNGNGVILEDNILSFKKRYLEPPSIIYKSDNKRSFLWGYYFNLIVSKLWIDSFIKSEDVKNYLNANDIYDYEFLSKNGYGLIKELDKSEINLNKCEDFDAIKLIQLNNKIVKYYKNNRSIINSENIKNFKPETIEEFVIKAEKLCISNLIVKA